MDYYPETDEKQALSDQELSGPALRAFFSITDKWDLDDAERMSLLGEPGRTTFYKWKQAKHGALSRDTLERISYVLGIYKALHLIFSDDDAADGWIKRANTAPLFGGRSALAHMLSGHVADLYVVRQYLDAERGVWA